MAETKTAVYIVYSTEDVVFVCWCLGWDMRNVNSRFIHRWADTLADIDRQSITGQSQVLAV